MARLIRRFCAALLTGLFCHAAAAAGPAPTVADFYRGRTVTILVGSGPGGAYDLYSRMLARFWPEHVPGHPTMVVQNMPGANGVTMTNYLAASAPRDGSVIGAPFAANVIEPLVDIRNATKYDPRSMNWIGNVAPQYNACFVSRDSKIKSIADAMRMTTLISATGANSNSSVVARLYDKLLGTKFKVISGYSSSGQFLAIQRKEVDGACVSYGSVLAAQPDLVRKNLVVWLIALSAKPIPELPAIPPAGALAHNEKDREIIDFLATRNLLGRPYAVPAGVPLDRVKALRASFQATMRDPGYLAAMKAARMEIAPIDARKMQQVIAHAYATPPDVVHAAAELIKGRD